MGPTYDTTHSPIRLSSIHSCTRVRTYVLTCVRCLYSLLPSLVLSLLLLLLLRPRPYKCTRDCCGNVELRAVRTRCCCSFPSVAMSQTEREREWISDRNAIPRQYREAVTRGIFVSRARREREREILCHRFSLARQTDSQTTDLDDGLLLSD